MHFLNKTNFRVTVAARFIIVLLGLIVLPLSSSNAAINRSTATSRIDHAAMTLQQRAYQTMLQNSINVRTLPANLTPTLQVISQATSSSPELAMHYFIGCNAANNPEYRVDPTPCFLGDLSSTKTIVLVGDSNTGNYAAALDVGLKAAKVRLALFPYSSCPASAMYYTKLAPTATPAAQCNLWHEHVPIAIAALRPIAMVLVSAPLGTYQPRTAWIAGIAKFFDQVTKTSPQTRRILMGSIPYFQVKPAVCLSIKRSPEACMETYSQRQNFYRKILDLDSASAAAAKAVLVPANQWLCWKETCPSVIGKYLAYFDNDHFTQQFVLSLAPIVSPVILAEAHVR